MKTRGHLLFPVFFLLYMLFFSGTTVIYSAVLTIVVTVITAQLKRNSYELPRLLQLADGAKQTVSVANALHALVSSLAYAPNWFGLTMANTIIILVVLAFFHFGIHHDYLYDS